ncbi:hypothetical protein BJ742DRAFT_911155 [Cladochytrium replicatum]|nr:hypothetical protein BJ742DRAFT_911155 [Cladochytrium replicatum]
MRTRHPHRMRAAAKTLLLLLSLILPEFARPSPQTGPEGYDGSVQLEMFTVDHPETSQLTLSRTDGIDPAAAYQVLGQTIHWKSVVEADGRTLMVPSEKDYRLVEAMSLKLRTNAKIVASQAFNITTHCSVTDVQASLLQGIPTAAELCKYITAAITRASTRLMSAVNIYSTINVEVNITSLGTFNNVLGSAGPASYFRAGRGANPSSFYLYPQALVKQLRSSISNIQYSPADIVAVFYIDKKWWFPELSRTIAATENDFEGVALHELTHGLGMVSRFITISEIVDISLLTPDTQKLLLPPVITSTPQGDVVSSLQSWQPLGVFDSHLFIVSNSRSLADYARSIAVNFPITTSRSTPETFYADLVSAVGQDALAAMRVLYSLATTTGAVKFANGSTDTSSYLVSTTNPFAKGSNLHHVDSVYDSTEDFLMTPSVKYAGSTLTDLVNSRFGNALASFTGSGGTNASFAPIGPAVSLVLESIGWPTARNPDPILIVMPVVPSGQGGTATVGAGGGASYPSGAVSGSTIAKGTMNAAVRRWSLDWLTVGTMAAATLVSILTAMGP